MQSEFMILFTNEVSKPTQVSAYQTLHTHKAMKQCENIKSSVHVRLFDPSLSEFPPCAKYILLPPKITQSKFKNLVFMINH